MAFSYNLRGNVSYFRYEDNDEKRTVDSNNEITREKGENTEKNPHKVWICRLKIKLNHRRDSISGPWSLKISTMRNELPGLLGGRGEDWEGGKEEYWETEVIEEKEDAQEEEEKMSK